MTKKIQLKITGMHCTSCCLNIDGELEDTEGIKESNTSYAKAQTEVVFDSDKVKQEEIIKIIENVGYEASIIK